MRRGSLNWCVVIGFHACSTMTGKCCVAIAQAIDRGQGWRERVREYGGRY
jgi:hypothetical protein